MPTEFELAPMSGHRVLQGIADAVKEAFPGNNYRLDIGTNIEDFRFNAENVPASGGAKNAQVASIIKKLIDSDFVQCRDVSVSGLPGSCSIAYRKKPQEPTATLTIHSGGMVVIAALAKHFALSDRDSAILQSLPKIQRDKLTAYEQTINDHAAMIQRLEGIAARQIEDSTKLISEKMATLEEEYAKKRASLDSQASENSAALDERLAEFKKKEHEFDTRESKHVRRELLERMIAQIQRQSTVKLSVATSRKRWATLVLGVVVIVGLALFAWSFSKEVLRDQSVTWYHVAPLASSALFLVLTIIYFLKWNDKWATAHADAEFRNMRFSADILRASWIAELIFEWETEKQREFPDALIEHFTRNLFQDDKMTMTDHPTEQIGKFLGQIKSVTVDQAGFKLEKIGDKAGK